MTVVARVSESGCARTPSPPPPLTTPTPSRAGGSSWQAHLPQLAAGACSREGERRALLQNVLAAENELVVIPAQDLLGLGSGARMNAPAP